MMMLVFLKNSLHAGDGQRLKWGMLLPFYGTIILSFSSFIKKSKRCATRNDDWEPKQVGENKSNN